jgi:hypothetical protein
LEERSDALALAKFNNSLALDRLTLSESPVFEAAAVREPFPVTPPTPAAPPARLGETVSMLVFVSFIIVFLPCHAAYATRLNDRP